MKNFELPPLWAIISTYSGKIVEIYQKQLEFYSKRMDMKDDVVPPATMSYGDKEYTLNAVDTETLLQSVPPTFEVEGTVATLPIEGVIIPKSDFFTLFFGGFAALDILTRDFRELAGREDVHTIILDIDSPGGNAFGVQQFANIIFEARSEKNIIAVTSAMMASAAMWIGAAAHKVFITAEVTVTGSIGTVTTHTDISELNKMIGITETEVTGGEFKRIPSSLAPLDERGRAVLQAQVDHVNSAFINDIAKFKNIKPGAVSKMAEGRIFIGSQGIKVGLVDGIVDMDDLFAQEGDIEAIVQKSNSNFNNFIGGSSMTVKAQIAEMKTNNADLYNAIVDEGKVQAHSEFSQSLPEIKTEEYKKGVEAGKIEGKEEGMEAERNRISTLMELKDGSNEAQIELFIKDGKTTAPEAAVAILKTQKENREKGLDNLKKGAPDALGTDARNGEGSIDDKDKLLSQLVKEYRAENPECTHGQAITACHKLYPDAKNDYKGTKKTS